MSNISIHPKRHIIVDGIVILSWYNLLPEATVLRTLFTALQSKCAHGETVIVDSIKFVVVHYVHVHITWHNGNGTGSYAVHGV